MDFQLYDENKLRQLSSVAKYIDKNDIYIAFEIGPQKFHINIPRKVEDNMFLELPSTISGYEWLNQINEFIYDKKPTLERLIKYIEKKYETKNKQKTVDLFDIPDITINRFDLQDQRYKRTLESKLGTMKSSLNLQTNTDKASVLFTGKAQGIILMNEFFELRKKYSNNQKIEISLVNDNIYHWNLKFKDFTNQSLNKEIQELHKNFGYNYLEMDVHFHDTLYPGYPPFIRVIRPRLNDSLMHRITNLKMTQLDYWSPCRGMSFIINKLINILDKYCSIDALSEMNNVQKYPQGAYHSLESILIKLSSLCDVKDDYQPLDDENYQKVVVDKSSSKTPTTTSTKTKSVWKPGTGYGTSGSVTWDPNEYIKLQEEKDKQIRSVIDTIIENNQSYEQTEMPMIYKILDSSYIMTFIKSYLKGTNMLDMSKHIEMYKHIFSFLQLLTLEEAIFLFDKHNSESTSLYEILKSLNNEAKHVIKLSKSDGDGDSDISYMICTLYEMIDPLYQNYLKLKQEQIVKEKDTWNKKVIDMTQIKDDVQLTYTKSLDTMKFDILKFTSGYVLEKEKEKGNASKQTIKRLAKEYASLANSLPIFYGSSIFIRINELDNRMIKVLITGPSDTPYDSGCFMFDVYIGNSYPAHAPKMLFVNHGGKRFNPNLYNCGKVCLSLLGTWRGQGGENWNPETSTLQQLFISVQAQILIEQPFYNEPGHEQSYNSASGMETSRQYNCEQRYNTMEHTMYDLLVNPNKYPEFSDVIKTHFKLKKDYILQLCDKWCKEPKNSYEKQTIEVTKKVKELLMKL